MKRNRQLLKAVTSIVLVIMLIATNFLGLYAAGDSATEGEPGGQKVQTAMNPDGENTPVTVALSVPASYDVSGTGAATDLIIDLSLNVKQSGVKGLNVAIPLKSPDGVQYFGYDLVLEGVQLPEPVTSIIYNGSTLTISFQDDLPTGTYGPISFVLPLKTDSGGISNGTVLLDSKDVIVSADTPVFSAALSSVQVVAGAPVAGLAGNNVLTGLWQDNGTNSIEDVYAADANNAITVKTINYSAVLDGTEDTKTIEITLPWGLVFQSTAPTSSQIPGIIDSMTVFKNSTPTTGGTLKLVFDKGVTGLVCFDVIVSINTLYIYSNESLIINNKLSVGSTVNTTETTMRIHDYRTRTVFMDMTAGISPNNVQDFLYSNYPTTFSLVDGYDPYGVYFTVTGNLKTCTLVYDLSRYIAVQDAAGGAFRPLAKDEISIVNSDTCVYDPDTMQLTLKVASVHNAESCQFTVALNIPAGAKVRLGADATAVSGTAYENNFTDIPDATFTNFSSYKPRDITVKALAAEIDIFTYRPYTYSTTAPYTNYITPNTDYESLFTVGATTYQTGFENIRFKVNIPSNATITHIFAQNTAGTVETPVKIYKDASDQNPQVLSGGINKLDVPISGVTSFEVEYAKFYANKSIKVASNSNLGLRFFGSVSGSVGDNVTFSIDPASITAVCSDIADVRVPATDMGNNNSFTTTLTDKKYYDIFFLSKQLLKNDQKTLITGVGPVKPGDIVYWGVTMYPDKNNNYYSAVKNFYQPVCYFSVPPEFLPVNGVFTKDDLYAGLSVEGGPFLPYDVDKLIFEIVPTQGANYNRGNVMIKVSAPEVNLYTNDNNLTTYFTDATVDSLRIFLRVKVDETIFVTKNVDFHIYGQLIGTSYDKALGPGRGTSNNNIPESDKIQGIPAVERILFNGDPRSVTISVVASATMASSVEPKGRSSFVSYDTNDPASIPPISAGDYGLYKVRMSNGMPTAINNAVGYFMFPSGNGWAASIIGALTPTAGSITNGVSVFYTTDTGLNGATLQTNDTANWTALTSTTSAAALTQATGIKIMVDSLATGEYYEAEMPFFAQTVDYRTVSYVQGKGNTSYNMAAASVASGKTAGLELVQSNPPVIVPIDSGYSVQGVKSVSLNDDVSSINANILRAAVTDDITGNITEEPFKQYDLPMGLDMAGSTIRNGAGVVMSFADIIASGGNPISSSADDTYLITYKSYQDHDSQVTTVTRTIIVGAGASPGTSTLSGTITDSVTGEPIPGATVKVTDKNTGTVYTVTTDGDGKYSVPGIPTGDTVQIEVSADGYADKKLPDVTITGDTTQDAQLDPNSGGTGTSTLSGTITDSVTGEPIPGATVKVTDKDTGTVYTVTTDGNGKYSVPGIPTGDTLQIEVSADGYADKKLPDVTITGDTQRDAQLDPNGGGNTNTPSYTLSGTITDSVTGEPIPGATVKVTDKTTGDVYTVTTDNDGNYSVPGIPNGDTVEINVSADGYADKKLPDVTITGDTTQDAQLDPNGGGNTNPPSYTLSGTITDSVTGEPIPGATVKVTDKDTGTVYTVTTDGDGKYSVPGIPTGDTVQIEVSADGYADKKLPDVIITGNTKQDAQLDPEPQRLPYVIDFYMGSDSPENLIDEVTGISVYPVGRQLTEVDITHDLGEGWLKAKKPDGYDNDTEYYPVITAGNTKNVVKVIYKKLPVYPYRVDYYKDSVSAGNLLGSAAGRTSFNAGHLLTAADVHGDLGDSWLDNYMPSGYAHGTVQGGFPVISVGENVVTVLYSPVSRGGGGDSGGGGGSGGYVDEYTYIVEYYRDNMSPGSMLGKPVYAGAHYPAGHRLSKTDLSRDLGSNWLNARRPKDCKTGAVQGMLPIITADLSNNVVRIVYAKTPSHNYNVEYYTDDTSPGNKIADESGKSAYPEGHTLNGVDVADDLGSDWVDRYKPDGYENNSRSYPVITGSSGNTIKIVYAPLNLDDFITASTETTSKTDTETPAKKPNPKTSGSDVTTMLRVLISCCILAVLALIWQDDIRKRIKNL